MDLRSLIELDTQPDMMALVFIDAPGTGFSRVAGPDKIFRSKRSVRMAPAS